MINPAAYTDFVASLDDAVARARMLGLYRTAERLHEALREARGEVHEAMPRDVPTVEWTVGPVSEQRTNPQPTKK